MRLCSPVKRLGFFLPFQTFLVQGGMEKSALSYTVVSGATMTFISTLAEIGVEPNKEMCQLPLFRIIIYPDAFATNSVMSSVTVVLTSIHCKF